MDAPIPKLSITIGGTPLIRFDDTSVTEAVRAYNARPDVGREALPDDLNPRCVSASEAIAFLRALPNLGWVTRKRLSGTTLDLSEPSLKLGPVDGFGVRALAAKFSLSRKDGHWAPSPTMHRGDVQSEFARALGLVRRRTAELATAEQTLAALQESEPTWPEAHRAVAMAKQALALAQSVQLGLTDAALDAATTAPLQISGETWDHARVHAERARLEAALGTAPAVGGMP